ncbi:MAG TPA: LysE family transporter [Kaistiaceae bacterium]|nr:LysE family transporter [Kaistiaceae bacterium]
MAEIPFHALMVGWLALVAAAAAPGPNLLAVAAASLGSGRPAGIAVSLGVATGTFGWALATVLGFTLVFAARPELIDVLRLAGGAYLVFLGARAIRAGLRNGAAAPAPQAIRADLGQCYLRGLGVVATNPKALLFWTSVAALVVTPGMGIAVAVLFAAVSMLISTTVYSVYAFVFSLPRLRARYRDFAARLEIAFGALFCLFGARLLAGR